jgi:hypothetical protein
METVSIILIMQISNFILQPLLTYILHSRCTEIKCCGAECTRKILEKEDELS